MSNKPRMIWSFLVSIKYSAWATLSAAVLGVVGMGVLGLGLYFAVSFALPSALPTLDSARGDWVWPALIVIGMFWSLAFLMAGTLNRLLCRKALGAGWRRLTYALVLWLWALLLWWATLHANR